MRFLAVLLLLAACSRPLTDAEVAFSGSVQGDALATRAVRIHEGALIGGIVTTRDARPQTTCRERIWPKEDGEVQVQTAAIVLFQRMFSSEWMYRDDFLSGYPDRMDLPAAMLFAHEMTHVWQWQNRATTGYHPLKAGAEHATSDDPYLFDLEPGKGFLDYGYEAQGGLVEEFVCCRALDPEAPRTARLHAMLSEVFPNVARYESVPRTAIYLPQGAADPTGICR